MRLVAACLFSGAILMSATVAGAQEIDWQKVDNAFGRKAAVVSGDVHRYGFPRTDLNVALDGGHHQTCFGAWRLGSIQADACRSDGWIDRRRSHGNGRSRALGQRD